MRIAIGSDERTALTDHLVARVRELGHAVQPLGPLADAAMQWPEVGATVARRVASGTADEGIVCCWTGTGVSIAANKVPGIRAALCADAETARGARRWNRANVLALSLRLTTPAVADEILEAWFGTALGTDPDELACVARIDGWAAVAPASERA
ncbi:MAG: RpiB/LacA/LacB family sugar-phosphate isomerase [Actinobacteria bacterium]|nr:RpiB/LacA/LacB family sugar-phosphate isomerase [Actinomycetota bacterium]